jgi:hypothetical protein
MMRSKSSAAKWITVALSLVVSSPVYAVEWRVLPNDAWAGDASVNVEYAYTAGSATGPVIGAAAVMIGPLMPGVERPITADQFVGRGGTVCLTANAVRGTERSVTVSNCAPFPLGPPSLLSPR